MHHEILASVTKISNLNCHAESSFKRRKTDTGVRFSFLRSAAFLQRDLSVFPLELFSLKSSALTLEAAPCGQILKNAAEHIKKNKKQKKTFFDLPLVPTDNRHVYMVCMCHYVLCMGMCSQVLQALVEVDRGRVGTGLSYPLLQICFQPAYAHWTIERWLSMILKKAALCW